MHVVQINMQQSVNYVIMGCRVFKRGVKKLERFLPKTQHTHRKLLNVIKYVDNMKCAPELVLFNEEKNDKILMIFDIEN